MTPARLNRFDSLETRAARACLASLREHELRLAVEFDAEEVASGGRAEGFELYSTREGAAGGDGVAAGGGCGCQ